MAAIAVAGALAARAAAAPGGRDAGAPAAAAPAACEAKVATFTRWIANAPRDASFVPVSEDARLVERDVPGLGDPLAELPTIEVRAHGPTYRFRYQPRGTIEGLRAALADEREGGRPLRSPTALIVAIEPDARWSAITAAVAAAGAAGFNPIALGFARVARITAPPPALTAETERISAIDDPFDRARNIALLFETVAKPCPALTTVFNYLGGVQANEKVGILMDRLPTALRRCQCATDPADMAQVVWLFLMPSPDGAVRRSFLDGRFKVAPPGAPATVVRAKKDATWAQVYQRVLDAAKPGAEPASVRLEVQGR